MSAMAFGPPIPFPPATWPSPAGRLSSRLQKFRMGVKVAAQAPLPSRFMACTVICLRLLWGQPSGITTEMTTTRPPGEVHSRRATPNLLLPDAPPVLQPSG